MIQKKAFKVLALLLTPFVFLDELASAVVVAVKSTWGHVVDTWSA